MSNASWKESISLEETNKIRISLGLKPLSDSGPSKATPDALAEENYTKRKAQESKESSANVLKSKLDKVRNQLERSKKLGGVGLGAEDESSSGKIKLEEGVESQSGGDDAKSWVKKQKKRAKEEAAKRAKELEEMDRRFAEEGLPSYGEVDLKGIKVAHDHDDFEEGEETVLTLKDSRVLDDEDDELHNLNISENSKTAEALALKKKGKQTYTGYDDDEFVEGKVGTKRSVLNKYDDEVEEGGFRLGGAPTPSTGKGGKGKEKAEESMEKERVKLSLDYTKSFTTDYLQADEAGFKIKKKKKRPTRVTTVGEDEESMSNSNAMDTSTEPSTSTSYTPRETNLDSTNLIDDDELQASLARTRRELNKKKIQESKARQEALLFEPIRAGTMELDFMIKKEEDAEDDVEVILNPSGYIDSGRLATDVAFDTLDDTSEFVRNIALVKVEEASSSRNISTPTPSSLPSTLNGTSTVIKSEVTDIPLSEIGGGGWGVPREDGEESDEEPSMMDSEMTNLGEEEDIKPDVARLAGDDEFTGTAGEALVSSGMASTLNLLRHQGLLEVRTPEQLAEDKSRRAKEAWLALQRKTELAKEEERRLNKEAGSSKDQHQREIDNRARERRDAENSMRAMESYKPVVDIKYQDEFGRNETPKEAWKRISHAFHGHGAGSTNTAKRLNKIAKELAAKAMAAGDTPLSSAAAFAERSERLGSATMILSVGNRGAAPIQEEMLDSLNKERALKKSAKGKGKASSNDTKSSNSNGTSSTSVFSDIPMRPLPLPSNESSNIGGSRAGFAPINKGFAPIGGGAGASSNSNSNSSSSNTTASQMDKLTPVSVIKRKPIGEPSGAPANKKV